MIAKKLRGRLSWQRSAAKLITKDGARRIAANIAKLPELWDGQWRALKPRAGSLTQIKVILSGRAENSPRPVQIRQPRPQVEGFYKNA